MQSISYYVKVARNYQLVFTVKIQLWPLGDANEQKYSRQMKD